MPQKYRPHRPSRSKYDSYGDVLRFCSAPKRPTEILYACNFNPATLKERLSVLERSGLLVTVEAVSANSWSSRRDASAFVTSPTGREFLSKLEELRSLLSFKDKAEELLFSTVAVVG